MGGPLRPGLLPRVAGQSSPKVIIAYHGSPHSFSRFDASKIGTGEGAQAYGHGLYFSGSEDVAKFYRDGFSGQLLLDGQPATGLSPEEMRWAVLILNGEADKKADAYRQMLDVATRRRDALRAEQAADPNLFTETPGKITQLGVWGSQARTAAEELAAYEALSKRTVERSRANMYEVELGVPEESLLDWDGTLTQQPEAVQQRYARSGGSFHGMRGEAGDGRQLWWNRRMGLGERGAANEMLNAGIPGIKYFTAASRRQGPGGTRNYVMFPGTEDRIRILRKYGLLAPMALPALQEDE